MEDGVEGHRPEPLDGSGVLVRLDGELNPEAADVAQGASGMAAVADRVPLELYGNLIRGDLHGGRGPAWRMMITQFDNVKVALVVSSRLGT